MARLGPTPGTKLLDMAGGTGKLRIASHNYILPLSMIGLMFPQVTDLSLSWPPTITIN